MQEILSFAFVLPEKRLNRDTKLIAILRRQLCIILTALEENIFSVLGGVAKPSIYCRIAVSKSQLVYTIALSI